MSEKITTIFFDLFGVLLGIDQSVAIQYLSKQTDTPYIQTREIAMGEPFMRLERSEINFSKYVEEIRTALPNGERINIEQLHGVWMNSRVGEMPAVSLLQDLKKKYNLWVISNTTDTHINGLKKQFSFLTQINGIITSERAGTHKPNPAIFRFALEEVGVEPELAVFIDDSKANVDSAESIGMVVHNYTGFEKYLNFINWFDKPKSY